MNVFRACRESLPIISPPLTLGGEGRGGEGGKENVTEAVSILSLMSQKLKANYQLT